MGTGRFHRRYDASVSHGYIFAFNIDILLDIYFSKHQYIWSVKEKNYDGPFFLKFDMTGSYVILRGFVSFGILGRMQKIKVILSKNTYENFCKGEGGESNESQPLKKPSSRLLQRGESDGRPLKEQNWNWFKGEAEGRTI